jgi:hypothetical protein
MPHGAPPIDTAHLFAELDVHLVDLLDTLTAEEWAAPTLVPQWNVRQVAAHLLDTALRRLSIGRDGWVAPGGPVRSEREKIRNNWGLTVFTTLPPS